MSSSPADTASGDLPTAATVELWGRLGAGVGTADAVAALLGFPLQTARQLVGAVLATSDEAEELLDTMPVTIRSLSIATTTKADRCHGEIRGPVMWSETMSARSASAGDEGLFVCALPLKAYDTLENRVLAAALAAVASAAREAEATRDVDYGDEVVRRAHHNGQRAAHWLEHRTLLSVPRQRPDGRAQRRARSGHRRRIYRPAVALLERAARPLSADHVVGYADARALLHHDLFAATVERLERRRHPCGHVHAEHGVLWCGPVRYRRPRAGDLDDGEAGVQVGDVLVDIARDDTERERGRAAAELRRRAAGRPHLLVTEPADIDRALDLAGFTHGR